MYPSVSSSLYRLSAATRRLDHFRRIMTATPLAAATKQLSFREIRIPVPWGHIAAKQWGQPDGRRVLALHGWQDNSGSFDTLVPHLPSDWNFVAIDLPGHGLSTHKPLGMLYNIFEWIPDVHRVVDHLQWPKFCLLGHSMGAGIAMGYTSCFPERVQRFVSLDGISPYVYPVEKLSAQIAKAVDELLTTEERCTRPPRPLDVAEVVDMMKAAMRNSITEESAHVLMRRGVTAVEGQSGKVIINRDPRLKVTSIPGVTGSQINSLVSQIRCPVMIILGSQGIAYAFTPRKNLEEILELYRKSAASFSLVTVEGTHHAHLNSPELVAPHVVEFFNQES